MFLPNNEIFFKEIHIFDGGRMKNIVLETLPRAVRNRKYLDDKLHGLYQYFPKLISYQIRSFI